jgi:hypothetical protein
MKGSFLGRCRAAAAELKEFGAIDLADAVNEVGGTVKTRQAITDLRRDGSIVSIKPGRYRFVPLRMVANAEPTIQEKMWRVVRAMRVFSVDDLVQMAGAKRSYASEFLQALVRTGYLDRSRAKPAIYRVMKDSAQLPRNDAKAEKLKEIRQRRKTELGKMKAEMIDSVNELCSLLRELHGSRHRWRVDRAKTKSEVLDSINQACCLLGAIADGFERLLDVEAPKVSERSEEV